MQNGRAIPATSRLASGSRSKMNVATSREPTSYVRLTVTPAVTAIHYQNSG